MILLLLLLSQTFLCITDMLTCTYLSLSHFVVSSTYQFIGEQFVYSPSEKAIFKVNYFKQNYILLSASVVKNYRVFIDKMATSRKVSLGTQELDYLTQNTQLKDREMLRYHFDNFIAKHPKAQCSVEFFILFKINQGSK